MRRYEGSAIRPTPPHKAPRLGYKAKQGLVIYDIRVRCGDRKHPVTKTCTYNKPKIHSVDELQPTPNLQSLAQMTDVTVSIMKPSQ
ncbi:hypothetical protein Pcinc_002427 [Petrolisthes cinctipes]|uniref:Ribosomal protein L15 n=1 Tax=Petrolisthes cinctipes TaxID=88211 RepID=A0AAE1L5F0_PETCI|nr:hypothetical protein Pcinc_002427 [Petrolisthes cinctipes]